MPGIGEFSGRVFMVMRTSGHIRLKPALEGLEYVLHHRLGLQQLVTAATTSCVGQTLRVCRHRCICLLLALESLKKKQYMAK
jgi:hypothetical protein